MFNNMDLNLWMWIKDADLKEEEKNKKKNKKKKKNNNTKTKKNNNKKHTNKYIYIYGTCSFCLLYFFTIDPKNMCEQRGSWSDCGFAISIFCISFLSYVLLFPSSTTNGLQELCNIH